MCATVRGVKEELTKEVKGPRERARGGTDMPEENLEIAGGFF